MSPMDNIDEFTTPEPDEEEVAEPWEDAEVEAPPEPSPWEAYRRPNPAEEDGDSWDDGPTPPKKSDEAGNICCKYFS